MSRAFRINYKNAWYHVMNRGTGSKKIFYTNNDRNKFLEIIEKTVEQYEIEIHAYCLMSNHYHLLMKTPRGNLSDAIKYLNGCYAMYFNNARKTDGPLFRGRFKSTLLSDDEHILHISRYIHLNPVRANIVREAEKYQWSSYSAYLNKSARPKWLILEKIYKYFPDLNKYFRYKMYVEKDDSKRIETLYENDGWISIFGNDDFVKMITTFKQKISNETTKDENKKRICAFDKINKVVGGYFGIEQKEIITPSFMKENKARSYAMWLSRKVGKYSLKEIAYAYSNKSYSSVSVCINRLEKKLKNDIELMKMLHDLEKQLRI